MGTENGYTEREGLDIEWINTEREGLDTEWINTEDWIKRDYTEKERVIGYKLDKRRELNSQTGKTGQELDNREGRWIKIG